MPASFKIFFSRPFPISWLPWSGTIRIFVFSGWIIFICDPFCEMEYQPFLFRILKSSEHFILLSNSIHSLLQSKEIFTYLSNGSKFIFTCKMLQNAVNEHADRDLGPTANVLPFLLQVFKSWTDEYLILSLNLWHGIDIVVCSCA